MLLAERIEQQEKLKFFYFYFSFDSYERSWGLSL